MAQISLIPHPISKTALKPISKILLFAEGLDLLTTFAGLLFFPQLWEANPMLKLPGGWSTMILVKIAATLFVVIIFERVPKWSRMVWIVPCIAAIPVVWNIINMLAEIAIRA
jgi:hypothetical protein